MNVAAMQSGPAPSLSVADLDPVATERLVRFDVVSLIGLAKRPDVRAQEKLLGGLSNATVRAFSQRLQILPGVTYAAR
ncbi:MAG TPA: hypothetical protein VLC93_10610, partial [Myxococcota bacterium]|nr:hypothetical protein [Myxococcota bacterium]